MGRKKAAYPRMSYILSSSACTLHNLLPLMHTLFIFFPFFSTDRLHKVLWCLFPPFPRVHRTPFSSKDLDSFFPKVALYIPDS